jgi:N-acetylneuraminate synthase
MSIQNFLRSSQSFETYFIGEIGINHNGNLDIAKQLIDMCADAGCDAVKFQKRTVEIVYTSEYLNSHRNSPWGSTQRDQKLGLEFEFEEYLEINRYCKEKHIEWTASAWDIASLEFLDQFDVPFHKVASAMATNIPFITEVAERKKFTLVSTGICTMQQIEQAVSIFNNNGCPFALLHTVSTYPSANDELNLSLISTLADQFKVPVGYSGHEASVSPTIFAAALGAKFIERHVTLDRAMYGSDQSASLEPSGLRQLVGALRKLPSSYGDGVKRITAEERTVGSKLRYWEES